MTQRLNNSLELQTGKSFSSYRDKTRVEGCFCENWVVLGNSFSQRFQVPKKFSTFESNFCAEA